MAFDSPCLRSLLLGLYCLFRASLWWLISLCGRICRVREGHRRVARRTDFPCKVPCDGSKGTGSSGTANGLTFEDLSNGTRVNMGFDGDGA